MEEVVVPSPKKPTAQQKVTSSLQSFNSQSQHEQQEFDYEDLLNAEELDKTSGVTLTSRLKVSGVWWTSLFHKSDLVSL